MPWFSLTGGSFQRLLTFSSWRFCMAGLIPWDKTLSTRAPHTGYFRHQCEYVVWEVTDHCLKVCMVDPGRVW
jgi:hypothetical protein